MSVTGRATVLLLQAVRDAPRRYRMPPLPAEPAAAGPEAALAVAIEAARPGAVDAAVQDLFARSLALLVAQALRSDAGLQALLLREDAPQVASYLSLAAGEAADRRSVAARVDAFAHPGKLRSQPEGAARDALARLHALARAGAWSELRAHAQHLAETQAAHRAQLQAVLTEPALERLERTAALRGDAAVQRYLALAAMQGPVAGSEAAVERGRAAALAGEAVEAQTLQAFATIAGWMEATGAPSLRAVQGLRPKGGFARAPRGAKDEWDVALLQRAAAGDAEGIVLLAECKSAPLAATGDWPRLLAGLRRLAHADAHADYRFDSNAGEVQLRGASLWALDPLEDGPPPHVFYACTAAERHVPLLSPAARALLLQEPESVACARALAQGAQPPAAQLAPLLARLPREPRLRPVLHQYATARRAREAMLHPDDLLAAAAQAFGVDAQGRPRNM